MAAVKSRWMVCFVAAVATAGCSNDCEELCRDVTDCRSYCDPGVETCDDPEEEMKAREADFDHCVSECEGSADEKGERCEEAISIYRDCVVRHSCGGNNYCYGEETRYSDSCFADTAGSSSCSHVCDQLEFGCYPYELFGYRGPDCEDVCTEAAKKGSCSEALFELQECDLEAPESGTPCMQADSSCRAKAETFVDRCAGFAPTTPDPDEEAFCAAAAITICLCNEISPAGPVCEPKMTDQCLFQLWNGEPCRAAWGEYVACLQSLEVCNGSTVYEECQMQAVARAEACPIDG